MSDRSTDTEFVWGTPVRQYNSPDFEAVMSSNNFIAKNTRGFCAYRGCDKPISHWKAGAAGVQIGYCEEHFNQSVILFETVKKN